MKDLSVFFENLLALVIIGWIFLGLIVLYDLGKTNKVLELCHKNPTYDFCQE